MWNSMRGYVIIQISEGQPERLLNKMHAESIPVYDVRRSGRSIECRIALRNFRQIRPIRRICRCRIRIVERLGFPFAAAQAMERKTLLLCCLAAVGIFLLLSTRMWVIPIAGCRDIPEQVIARALREQGIYPGASKKDLVLYRIAELARLYDDRIAAIEMDLDGIVCQVNVTEAIKKGETVDRSIPTDVVAAKNGVISRIAPYNGLARVKVGQPVLAGEILIAGDITAEGAEESLFVHAYGDVSAFVAYSSEVAVPLTYKGLADSGSTEPYRCITVAGICMFETASSYEHYVLTDCGTSAPLGTLLPIRISTGTIREQTEQPLSRSEEECIELAIAQAEQQAYEKLPKDGKIARKETTFVLRDGVVIGVCSIAMEESIGYIKEIGN